MRKLLLGLFLFIFLINISFGETLWGFSLQEGAYYFSSYIDLGLFISPLMPYGLFILSPERNIRFWVGASLNESFRIGGGFKFYPNLVLNIEFRDNEKYLEVLIPFILEKLYGGVQINIGILGSTSINIESAFSYPINKSLSLGTYIYFPFTKPGKVFVFGKYYWKDYYWSLAFDGENILLGVLRYLKF
ncbi:MAG: hypothetical protein N2312_04995 [Dictyoglomaceae bacterium]|nr:hypothetical protein [Dictyoglomaceae bacterium]